MSIGHVTICHNNGITHHQGQYKHAGALNTYCMENPSIGHKNGNARHRGQYKHAIAPNTWCMDPIQ